MTLTGGGRTLQMPVFSAMGRILLMKAYGSRNSSQLGSKTGHSGGGLNSSGRGWLIVSDDPVEARTGQVTVRRMLFQFNNYFLFPVYSPLEWVAASRHQHERRQLTHTHTHTLRYTHNLHTLPLTHTHSLTVRRMFQGRAVSTSARKTRHHAALIYACANYLFLRLN